MHFVAATAFFALSGAWALPATDQLSGRGNKDIVYASMPSKSATCPQTNRYEAHTFTDNQIKVAFLAGAGLNAAGKQLGANQYPHKYNSNQALPNDCGSETQEFPILFSNTAYVGEGVQEVPDRVLYEVKDKGNKLQIKYCGVIRHGNGNGFENCA
ncbi:hypothetical protein ACEQ8H_006574 [Pleosporales sp. CAS-2024a]